MGNLMRYFPAALAIGLAAIPAVAQHSPPPVKMVVPLSVGRVPHQAPEPGSIPDLSLPDLGNFDFDPDDSSAVIPADVKALSGTVVRLHGFMIPLDQAEKISRFALVPDLGGCQQHSPPPTASVVLVICLSGKAVTYCPDEVIVEGRLTVEIIREDGLITRIFTLEPASVKPAARKL
jgi:hypothetical protein